MGPVLSAEEKNILESLVGKRVAVMDALGCQTANAIYKGVIDGDHVFVGAPGTWNPKLSDSQMTGVRIVLLNDQESETLWYGFERGEKHRFAFEGHKA